jgi:hypothetical protein
MFYLVGLIAGGVTVLLLLIMWILVVKGLCSWRNNNG